MINRIIVHEKSKVFRLLVLGALHFRQLEMFPGSEPPAMHSHMTYWPPEQVEVVAKKKVNLELMPCFVLQLHKSRHCP